MTKARPRYGLTVDWDFFIQLLPTGNPFQYDWGFNEKFPAGVQSVMWQIRYAQLRNDGVLDHVRLYELEDGFWDAFTFSKDATVTICDSHSVAYSWAQHKRLDEVWNFDAHHDFGYDDDVLSITEVQGVDCGNWGLKLAAEFRTKLHVRYPTWKTSAIEDDAVPDGVSRSPWGTLLDRQTINWDDPADGGETYPVFDSVLICRSSPWCPPWFDQYFLQFCQDLHLKREVFGWSPANIRPFDHAGADRLAIDLQTVTQAYQNRRELVAAASKRG